jgi:hypothetical protein
MTKYRSSSNLSYARAGNIIPARALRIQNIAKPNKIENNLDRYLDSVVVGNTQVRMGIQVRQNPRSSIDELIPSLEKFGFPNLTCHHSKARKHKKSEHLVYADLRHWTVGGG